MREAPRATDVGVMGREVVDGEVVGAEVVGAEVVVAGVAALVGWEREGDGEGWAVIGAVIEKQSAGGLGIRLGSRLHVNCLMMPLYLPLLRGENGMVGSGKMRRGMGQGLRR